MTDLMHAGSKHPGPENELRPCPLDKCTFPAIAKNLQPASIRLSLLLILLLCIFSATNGNSATKGPVSREDLWALKPVARPEIPKQRGSSTNPVDAFLQETWDGKGIRPMPLVDRLAWLRRVTFDLVGLPPTLQEQEDFLSDTSGGAMEKVVDRLLSSEQHGVRYGRHWLDALRYSDVDEDMPAANGIHYWRDWVIHAINSNLSYAGFVRAQISGNRAEKRRIISAAGHLTPVEPRPEDLFASGFLSRGAATRSDSDQNLAFSAVETISSAFLGMTVSCAKCHDHFYDPITQSDYYAMKALFDPLVLRPVEMATPEQIFAHGRAVEDHESRLKTEVEAMRKFIAPYHDRLYEERLRALPPEAQAAIRKPEGERSSAEQKTYDDYYPVLRIDPPKIKSLMTTNEVAQYEKHLKRINELKPPEAPPVFWAVQEDAKRADEERFVLQTGNPTRPKKSAPVKPGFPFANGPVEIRGGRRETFVDWLTSSSNPMFARVAVNRIWQWHFGTGLHENANDFGALGGPPIHPKLLDWLASEFTARDHDMKWLHRLIVLSDAYRLSSRGNPAIEAQNGAIDPANRLFWRFPLKRLEAEPVRDSILQVAGKLNTKLGGRSFNYGDPGEEGNRRTAYLKRGFRTSAELMPEFLQNFDAEDGRSVCARRLQTVTAPQALWLMNDDLIEQASTSFGSRLLELSSGDLVKAVQFGYQTALCRPPSSQEKAAALELLKGDPGQLKPFAWLLLNLDEFLYLR